MIGVGIGIPFFRSFGGGIDAQAQAHFNRVIADGGVVPSGLTGVNAFFSAVKAIYGTSDINTAISAAYDPHYLGYKLGAGSGTTLGQAAQTLYSVKGIFGGIGTGSAYWEGVGVIGNNVTTPAIVSPSTQVDVVSYVYASAGHTNSATILSNDGANRNFVFNCSNVSSGILQLRAGTPFTNFNSTTGVGNFDNYTGWIRATYNQNGINGDVTFYTSTNSPNTPINSITWVQLGSVVSSASTGLQTGTHSIQLGSNQGSNIFIGRIGIAAFSTSIGGSPSVLFNANQYTGANTWTSTTGEVWTVNSTGAGLADVTQTTAASQPLLLAHTGENYWFGSGVTNNFVSTPNAAANQITGDLEIITRFTTPPDMTSNVTYAIAGKWNVGGSIGTNSYLVITNDGGNNNISFAEDNGTATRNITAPITWAANTEYLFKFVSDVNNGAGGNTRFIYRSTDNGVTWTLLNSNTQSGIYTRNNTNRIVEIGSLAAGTIVNYKGRISRVTISNAIDGTPVVDFNPSSYNPANSQTQWSSATGEVWSINVGTATSGYKGVLVDRSLIQTDGIDDTLLNTFTNTFRTTIAAVSVNRTGGFVGGVLNNANLSIDSSSQWFYTLEGLNAIDANNILSDTRFVNNAATTTYTAYRRFYGQIDLGATPNTANGRLIGFLSGNNYLLGNVLTLLQPIVNPNSTQRTQIYNAIRGFNNNAF